MNDVYVTGHRNPDTDSICSAIAYAALKQQLDAGRRFVPCRLGPLNPQTTWVLEQAGVPAPMFLGDVHVRVADLMTRDVITVPADAPLLTAVEHMQQDQVRLIPVVSPDGRPEGIITSFSLTDHLLHVTAPSPRLEAVITRRNLADVLQADVLCGDIGASGATEETVEFVVAVMGTFSFARELADRETGRMVLFTSDRNDIIRTAIERRVGTVVVTGGCRPSEEAIGEAISAGVLMMVTPYSITQALNRAKLAIPAGLAAETGELTIREDVLRSEARRRLVLSHHRGFVVVNEEGRLTGILTRSDLLKNARKQVILVDHNEAAQSVPGLYDADLLEVVDHHRIGNFSTDRPITYLCRPTGSTCTIVAAMFRERGLAPDAATARILLSGILSDTVLFRSPTCTPEDRELAEWLAGLASLAVDAYGLEMFRNTSFVATRSDTELVGQDRKVFTEDGIRFSVSQIEVVGLDEVRDRLDGLLATLAEVCRKEGYLFAELMVTDIVSGDSLVLHAGDLQVGRETGFSEESPGVYLARNLISRKKQLLPRLLAIVKELNREPI